MKKYIMVAAPFFLLIGVITLSVTYALFESSKKFDTQVDIAKWQVKVNQSLIEGHSSTFTVDNVDWESSPYVVEGKAAPGLSGYFDIEIDPNQNETSIRYDVLFDFSRLDSSQFLIDSIVEVDNKNIVRTGAFKYSNIMLLSEIDNNETNTIRVTLTWVNNEANNIKDSNLGRILNNKIDIPIVVTITQHEEGEVLTEYIGP